VLSFLPPNNYDPRKSFTFPKILNADDILSTNSNDMGIGLNLPNEQVMLICFGKPTKNENMYSVYDFRGRGIKGVFRNLLYGDMIQIYPDGTYTNRLYVSPMDASNPPLLGLTMLLPTDYNPDLASSTIAFNLEVDSEALQEISDDAEERLYNYMQDFPVEKIYVHQDRTRYMAGETIWFKAYQDFSKENDEGSGVLYVELIDGMNQQVLTGKWRLENKMAEGQIELPDTLPSGNYQLRAYTRWMQNPGMENYFTREIQVFSSQPPAATTERLNLQEPAVELHFFPEGGNLVEGIPSKVAFKVTDQFGKGLETSGIITDQTGQEVRRFRTQSDGMGFFTFMPEPGKRYQAHLENGILKQDFPGASSGGVVMELKNLNEYLRVTLRHNLNIVSPLSPFYLAIHQKGEVYFTSYVDLAQSLSVQDIPTEILPEGIFTVTVYDENLHAWCERLAFVNYPETVQLQVATEQATYGRRQKVTVQIEAKDSYGSPQAGNFSLAVTGSGLCNSESRNDFYSDYFLQSELRGRIENPASYFEERDTANLRRIDLLLMTHGWRKYAWNNMVSLKNPEIQYPVETSLGFAGKVELGRRQASEEVGVTALLRLNELNQILIGQLDEDGSFRFSGYHFSDTAEVLISAVDSKNSALKLSVEKPVFPAPSYFSTSNFSSNDSLKVEIFGSMPVISGDMENTVYELPEIQVTARAIRRRSSQLHSSDHSITTYEVNATTNYSLVSGSGASLDASTGALALLNYIPGYNMLRQSGKWTGSFGANVEPFYILNGTRVTGDVLRLTPANMIARVELLNQTSAMSYGMGAFGGAVAFYTRDPNEIIKSMPTNTVSYRFAGYNQEKEFYAPNYTLPQSNYRPDYRKTLYWQPDIILDENGRAEFSFFTSDDRGEYVIHCEGISDKNEIGVSQSRFSVY
jgi:hypothetical protein